MAGFLGYTVAELLQRISASELQEWQAFYCIEPFGHVRGDLQAARICEAIAVYAGAKSVKMKDFILDFNAAKQTPEDIDKTCRLMATMFGAKK